MDGIFVLLGAILLIAIFLAYLWYFNLRLKINVLKTKNIMLTLGERELLSYKKLVELRDLYLSINPKKDDSYFIELAIPRVIEDIQSLSRYDELSRYMKGYEADVSKMLLAVHRSVIKSCGAHAGQLFSDELDSIKKMDNQRQQLQAITSLCKELEAPAFEGFYFQKGNLQNAQKFKAHLNEQMSIDKSKVVSIMTPIDKANTGAS